MKPGYSLAGCVIVFSVSTLAIPLRAEQPAPSVFAAPDPFEALQKALRAEREAKARTPGGATVTGREVYETSSYLEGIRQSLSRGDEASALNALGQLEAATTTTDVRRACDALVEKMTRDRAAREQAFGVELELAIKHAGEVVLRAREPKELDAVINDFNRLTEARSTQYSDGRDNRTAQKIQGAITFLSRWQEYLVAQAKGDDQTMVNALRNLTGEGYNHTMLIPRSEILARIPATNRNGEVSSGRPGRNAVETNNAVAEILDATHTLDDIPAALVKLLAYWTTVTGNQLYAPDNTTDLGASISNLQSLQKAQSELRAGLTTTINLAALRAENSSRPAIDTRLAGLRAELLELALPRLLGAPDTKPSAGEGATTFLRRLIDEAKVRGDWASVARGLEISRTFTSNQTAYSAANVQESDAFKLFFAALNMETAGQYEQAAIGFLSALKTGVQDLPSARIGEHLATLRKDHPREYEDATTYILNPPTRQYGNDPFLPSGRRPGESRNRAGFQGAADPSSSPAEITVPALSPPPEPPTAPPTPAQGVGPAPKPVP